MELLGFFQPTTIGEAKDMLSKYSNSKLMAGGTDLVLNLRREDEGPEYVIDIRGISELKNIIEKENEVIIGSVATFTQIRESETIKNCFGSLIECAKNMGSPQIRNMATIGGNIANAGSAADIVPCIMSLDGLLIIESTNGTRQVSCEDYFKNYSIEKIKGNEVLTKIIIPKKSEVSGYYKLGKRNALAIARVSSAVSLKIEDNNIKSISVCLGAVGRFPFRAKELEKRALGENVDWLYGEEPLKILENEVCESIKGRKTMPFKKEAIKGVYKEALRIAIGR